MISDLERQRVAQYQQQRERYLHHRRREIQPTLAADRRLLATRYRFLPAMLVTPYAVLAVAGALDLLFLVTGNGLWTTLSFALIGPGIIGSVVALAAGLHDWLAAPAGSRVRGVGIWFAIGTALTAAIFAQSWFARFGIASDAGGAGVVLGFIGASIALLTGWLLGEYLERLSAIQPADGVAAQVEHTSSGPIQMDEIIEQRQAAQA